MAALYGTDQQSGLRAALFGPIFDSVAGLALIFGWVLLCWEGAQSVDVVAVQWLDMQPEIWGVNATLC